MNTNKKTVNIIKKRMSFDYNRQDIFLGKVVFSLLFFWIIFSSPVHAQEKVTETVIVSCNSKQHVGRLLYVTDTELVLWQSNQTYNPEQLNNFALSFSGSQIDRIIIDKKGKFWTGAGYGLAIGGGGGAIAAITQQNKEDEYFFWTLNSGRRALKRGLMLGVPSAIIGGIIGATLSADENFDIQKNDNIYQSLVPELKKRAIFPFLPPPELQEFVAQNN